MTYILTDGLSGFSLEILQPGLLIWNILTSCTPGRQRERNPYLYSLPYFRIIPFVSLSILIGLVYAVVAPLLLPFLIVYFCLGYVVYINQVCFSKLVHIEKSAFTFHNEDWKWTWPDLMFVFYECCLKQYKTWLCRLKICMKLHTKHVDNIGHTFITTFSLQSFSCRLPWSVYLDSS